MTRSIPPGQSKKPLATPLAMSNASPGAAAAPIPLRLAGAVAKSASDTRPHPKPEIPKPKLRFKVRELTHPGALIFFKTTNPATVLSNAVNFVLQTLYIPLEGKAVIPPTRSITLILRSMAGVAYTTGIDLDDDHKEIHFSLDYIAQIPADRQQHEIEGVIVHEMVHCWQWNALGTAPGGLIEGIADFVRLKASLSPPHWKKESGGDWDAGYQHTAYFLEWIDARFGDGSVMRVNDRLRNKQYEEQKFWQGLFGKSVNDLWSEYKGGFEKDKKSIEKDKQQVDEGDDSEEGVLVDSNLDDNEEEGQEEEKQLKREPKKDRSRSPPSYFV